MVIIIFGEEVEAVVNTLVLREVMEEKVEEVVVMDHKQQKQLWV